MTVISTSALLAFAARAEGKIRTERGPVAFRLTVPDKGSIPAVTHGADADAVLSLPEGAWIMARGVMFKDDDPAKGMPPEGFLLTSFRLLDSAPQGPSLPFMDASGGWTHDAAHPRTETKEIAR